MPKVVGRKSRQVMRHRRVRRKVVGTAQRPRLSVFRSLNHMYAQVIDDTNSVTLAHASSLDSGVKDQRDGKRKSEVSALVGTLLAERAKAEGVTTVVFDRGGYKYHGRVKALAEAARKAGLVI